MSLSLKNITLETATVTQKQFITNSLGQRLELHGTVFGAIFVGFLPQLIAICRDYLPSSIASQPGLEPMLFGIILVLFNFALFNNILPAVIIDSLLATANNFE